MDSSEVVAIKLLKLDSERDEELALMNEAVVMAQLDHKNVVRLYGVVTSGRPIMLVIEYAQNNSLEQFLKSSNGIVDLTTKAKVKAVRDIADGMSHLAERGVVHRDLAARNILLTKDYVCKV